MKVIISVLLLCCFFFSQSNAAFAPVLVINSTINSVDIPSAPWGGYYHIYPYMGITYSGYQAFTGYYSANTAFYGSPTQIAFVSAQPFGLPCGSNTVWVYSSLYTNFTISYSGSNYNVTLNQYTLNRTEPLTMIHNIETFQCVANQFCLVTGFEGAASWQYTFFLNTINPPAQPSTAGSYPLQYTAFPVGRYDSKFAYAGGQSTLVRIALDGIIEVFVPSPTSSGAFQNVSLVATNLVDDYTFTCTVPNSYFPAFVFTQPISFSTKDYVTSMTELYSTRPPSNQHGKQSTSNVSCNYGAHCELNLGSDGWESYRFTFIINSN